MPLSDRIGALNELRKAGKVKNIGVSNFSSALMAEAVKLSDAPIVNNQVEYHPYLDQTKVLTEAAKTGMSVTAYYLMADGAVPKDEVLKDIGARHGKTAAQVVLRWAVQQKDVIALSKTATESRLPENFEVFDFALSEEEMQAVHKLARPDGRIVSPGHLAPDWDK
jgi:diketogulonate reductase-like aldo/keto reductase